MKVLVAVCLLGLLAVDVRGDAPTPVPEVDVPKYVGKWYQVYHNVYATLAGQPNTTCATIEYGVQDPTTLTVDNRYRIASPTGELSRTTGTAKITGTPGVLEVKFDNVPAPFNYYIMMLGPVDENNQYSYAAISDEGKRSLFFLVRDLDTIKNETIKTMFLTFATNNGFTSDEQKPIETYQGSDCLIPPQFEDPVLVEALDIDMYVGNWYMMYNNKNINDRVSANSKCATIQYGKVNATTLSVANRFRKGSPDGEVDTSGTGYAYATDNPAVFVVRFTGYPMAFDYRVMKVGPIMTDDAGMSKYSSSLVTDKNKNSVYVLVRDIEEFKEKYNDDVLEDLKMWGFDSQTSSPLLQYHGSDCKYPDGYTAGAGSMASLGMASLLLISTLYQLF